MQAAKNAVESVKESTANLGAAAVSGYEKTKATIQEKTDKISAHDESEKNKATQRKEEKIDRVEREKQQAYEMNAAAKQSAMDGHMDQVKYTTAGPGTEPGTIDPSGPGATNVLNSNVVAGTEAYNPNTETNQNAPVLEHGPGLGQGHGYEHRHGHGHAGLTDDAVGLRPVEAIPSVDTTARSAPPS